MESTKNHRRQHRSHKKRSTKSSWLITTERFFVRYGLGMAGGILFVSGLSYLLLNKTGDGYLSTLSQWFFNSASEITPEAFNTDPSVGSILSLNNFVYPGVIGLILLFLPGFLLLVIPRFLPEARLGMKNSIVLLGFFWLIFAEGKVFLYNGLYNKYFFPDFSSAFYFFLATQALLILLSFLNKNRLSLNLSVIFFFIATTLIRSYFGGLVPFFVLLNVLLPVMFFLSVKSKWWSPFVLSVVFGGLFIAFHILRKIFLAGNPEPIDYMLPSLIIWFVISITGTGILKPTFRAKYASKLWDVTSYISILMVFILMALMIKVSGVKPYYLLYCSLTAALLIILAILNERFGFLKSRRVFYYSVSITTAFILPLLMFSHFFVVLAASLSVTILVNAYIFRSRISLIISKVLFVIMSALYLLDWSYIINAFGDMISGGDKYPFHMLLSVVLVSSVSYFYLRLKSLLLSKYSYLERPALLPADIPDKIFPFMVYSSTLLLFDFALVTLFPGYSPGIIEPAMYSFAFIWGYNYLQPTGSKPGRIFRIVLSYLVLILYPVVINPEVNRYRYLLLEGQTNLLLPFLMHYACLIIMMLLLVQSNQTLRQLYHGENKTRHFRYLLIVILSSFMLLTEYDHLSLLLFSNPSGIPAAEMIILNKFLPYSIILILIAVSLLIFSTIKYSVFLRRVSLGLILLALMKIFLFDLKILPANSSVIVLISLGLVLLIIAWILQILRKKRKGAGRKGNHGSSKAGNRHSQNTQ